MRRHRRNREFLARAAAVVVGSTMVLTASFVGVLALVTGRTVGAVDRLPFYVLAMAVAFVIAVMVTEETVDAVRPERAIASAVGVAVVTFVFVSLGGEGIAYAVRNPGRVVISQLFFYFLAAGLIGTGLGYWGLRHWRELARRRGATL
jgi:hypothetical protein